MATLLFILLGTVLIQGSALAAGRLNQQHTARGVFADEFRTACFTLLTLSAASLAGYALQQLLMPQQLDYLLTPVLLLVLALIFITSRRLLEKFPGFIRWPNFIVHLSNQCAMLGMALFCARHAQGYGDALSFGVGAALMLAILGSSFTALRARINGADVPMVFRGIPIAMITAGFMALALLGFTGMVRN
jgi:electron transport complex protein RnfA